MPEQRDLFEKPAVAIADEQRAVFVVQEPSATACLLSLYRRTSKGGGMANRAVLLSVHQCKSRAREVPGVRAKPETRARAFSPVLVSFYCMKYEWKYSNLSVLSINRAHRGSPL